MEFNSPRPEHAQLQGQGALINPKGVSDIFASLNEQILASHRQADRSRRGNHSEDISRDEQGSFPLIAPRPLSARDGALFESVDENLIPSPPLSPKESNHMSTANVAGDKSDTAVKSKTTVATDNRACVSSTSTGDAKQKEHNGIYVRPVWDNYNGKSTKRYRLHINAFLSQYKVLKPRLDRYHQTSGSSRYVRRTRNANKTYASGSEFEKVYRTRRVTGEHSSAKGESEDDSVSYVPRSITPVRRKKHPQPSPLSHTVVHTAPNMSWEKLPDYSPSLDTLPANNNKCLKVDWKGSSMDLSHDPLKNKLHPAELVLAQILRLPCDLYLDSKRRFFMEKIHRLKQGMPFRRTDAQKACRIDVNKASRLYAAYEKIGWLEDSHFQKIL